MFRGAVRRAPEVHLRARLFAHAAVDVGRLLASGRHRCPGCGAAFHLGGAPAGFVDLVRLRDRLHWARDAPSAAASFYVANPGGTAKAPPSTFARQADWFGRTYSRLETDRIAQRMRMAPGDANKVLQQLRAAEQEKAGKTADAQQDTDTDAFARRLGTAQDVAGEEVLADPVRLEALAASLGARTRPALEPGDKRTPLVCQRCHDLAHSKHVHEGAPGGGVQCSADEGAPRLPLAAKDCATVADHLNSRAVLVWLCDATDVPASLPSAALLDLLPGRRDGEERPGLLLVANKTDLLPRSAARVAEYVEQLAAPRLGDAWRRALLGSHLVSARDGRGVAALADTLLRLARERDGHVFLLGKANAGKSRLYNRLVAVADASRATATVSSKPGTTVGLVRTPLASIRAPASASPTPPPRLLLFDLPGIVHPAASIAALLSEEECRLATLSARVRAVRRSLRPGESGLLGGFLRIECTGDDPSAQVVLKMHVRPSLAYLRLPTPHVPALLAGRLGRTDSGAPPFLTPPLLQGGRADPRWPLFADLRLACTAALHPPGAIEAVLADGIGWLSARLSPTPAPSPPVRLALYTPQGRGVLLRPPLPTQ